MSARSTATTRFNGHQANMLFSYRTSSRHDRLVDAGTMQGTQVGRTRVDLALSIHPLLKHFAIVASLNFRHVHYRQRIDRCFDLTARARTHQETYASFSETKCKVTVPGPWGIRKCRIQTGARRHCAKPILIVDQIGSGSRRARVDFGFHATPSTSTPSSTRIPRVAAHWLTSTTLPLLLHTSTQATGSTSVQKVPYASHIASPACRMSCEHAVVSLAICHLQQCSKMKPLVPDHCYPRFL